MTRNLRGSYVSVHLDLARGLSAQLVLLGHLRGLFFVDYPQVDDPSAVVQALYFLSGFGHEAVMVFFILSGFFISGNLIQSCLAGRWTWRSYAINRISRLYVVLIPGLLLTVFWDRLGMFLFPHDPIYVGTAATNIVPWPVDRLHGWGIFLGNVGCLQTIAFPSLGSNGALWSLSNEFWYYVMYPFLAIPFFLKTTRFRTVLFFLVSIALLCLIGKAHCLYFLIWLTGAALSLSWAAAAARRCPGWFLALSGLSFSAALVAVRYKFIPSVLGADFLVGATFAVFVFAMLRHDSPCPSGWYEQFAKRLAASSYSLYVSHLPFLVFCSAWFLGGRRWQPGLQTLFWALCTYLSAIAGGVLLWWLAERHTNSVRRWMTARWEASIRRARR
jgi:peptidoglycan/LPS O-acetylase OafA/YrhL